MEFTKENVEQVTADCFFLEGDSEASDLVNKIKNMKDSVSTDKVLMVVNELRIQRFVCEFEDDVIKTCSVEAAAALRFSESKARIIAENQDMDNAQKMVVIDLTDMYKMVKHLCIP